MAKLESTPQAAGQLSAVLYQAASDIHLLLLLGCYIYLQGWITPGKFTYLR
jgi:hypothetical protein